MSTALVGDFMVGVQPLWPAAPVDIGDVFDMPSWERPTPDTGYTPPDGTEETFTGSPVFTGGGTFEAPPGFDGATLFHSSWTEGDPGDEYDGGTITVASDGTVVSMDIRASRLHLYRIEVRDADGDLVSHVPRWVAGQLTRRLDQASTLEFRVQYDAEGAAYCVRPYNVWLRDRWGFIVDTFQIIRRRPVGQGDASHIEVICQGAVSQLAMEVVLEYAQETATTTLGDHVAALLALQSRTDALTLGAIDDTIAEIELPFFAYDTTIHAALLALQAALPKALRGRFYVDARRRLQWRVLPGDVTEQVITRGHNVYAIESETDYSTLVNRLYMYGEGQDIRDRLSLIDAGEATEYMDDSASITTYGLAPAIKVDRRIRYPATLLKIAERILEEFAAPQVLVRVDLLDLAKADDAPDGWRDIEIGGQYRVVDTALSVDSVVEIVEIQTDLSRPVPIRVELANQTKTLGDLISSLVDSLQQPLDVDGDRYPTMGRNYSERDARAARAGDVRWNDGGQMHDGSAWQDIGGGTPGEATGLVVSVSPTDGTSTEYARADHEHLGQPFISETSIGSLPTDDADGVIGYVSSGAKRLYAKVNGAWVAITVPVVTALPAIPDDGMAEVYWTSVSGTGDNQVWRAYAGQDRWRPTQKFSLLSGVPV